MYSSSLKKCILILFIALFFAQPAFAITIVSSPVDVSISATVGSFPNPLDDNCNGCHSGRFSGVIFSGWAYPGATVHVWKDGVPKGTTLADSKGYFSITFTELYKSNFLYTLYTIDKENRKSILLNYPLVAKIDYLTQISGIRFPPTISIDKTEVKAGDYITITGYSLPNTEIDLTIEGMKNNTYYLTSKADGTYQLPLPLFGFNKGVYSLHVNYHFDKKISKVLQFTIGEANILSIDLVNNIPGDCNADNVINIVDFSVAAYWYGKDNPPRCVDTNNDNIINLVDFSILAFYWTG